MTFSHCIQGTNYDNGTMVSFVVVETLSDKKGAVWEFRCHVPLMCC